MAETKYRLTKPLSDGTEAPAMVEFANRDSEGNAITSHMQETTHAELVALRDAGSLVPGRQYRITDYTCTTTQAETQSAGNRFDVIVIADSTDKLNENARACLTAGDAYFSGAGAKLESWEIKYCIDNDQTRFAWADPDEGKGVIYYMKDEWGNECPYDFKNIQFKRCYCTQDGTFDDDIFGLSNYWAFSNGSASAGFVNIDVSDCIWCYTFHDAVSESDASVIAASIALSELYLGRYLVAGNVIKEHRVSQSLDSGDMVSVLSLNDIVLYHRVYDDEGPAEGLIGNSFSHDCHDITLSKKCLYNSFEAGCYNNTLGNSCEGNLFRSGCYNNTLGNSCEGNSLCKDCGNVALEMWTDYVEIRPISGTVMTV